MIIAPSGLYDFFVDFSVTKPDKSVSKPSDSAELTSWGVAMMEEPDSLDGILERRQHTRLEGVFNVRFVPLSGLMAKHMLAAASEMGLRGETIDIKPGEHSVRGVTANFSEGGFCLLSDHRIPEGTHLLVDVSLPGLSNPVRAMTEVVRSAPALSNPDLTRHGLRFVAIHPEALTKIKTLVEQGLAVRAA